MSLWTWIMCRRQTAADFKAGDRVRHAHGWIGIVTGEPSDSGVVWCRFDGVGQYGADPKQLTPLAAQAPGGRNE